ncbi:related to single-stranded DNA-binding protein [Rhynchosporium secalis]|uniref:Related to single-stranded DNA-binding protein n=1 Tax=Rhynchosporium secalis TaxID=38038 RepID=A0A1E1MRN4_RHYSE|nr:related to single-stranded DNA-binding protein [Rhynchosporium secalis]
MSSFFTHRALRTAAPLSRTFMSSAPRSSFAKMTIIGRLASTPELQATSTGKEILKYTVATSSGPRDSQKTNWFRVSSFLPEGPQRDFISALDKGTLVYVEGDASQTVVEDTQSGKFITHLNIVQQKFEVLSKKPTQ